MKNKNLAEIAIEWLKANGFDGLYNEHGCGCGIDDLMPCGEPSDICEAAYKFWGEFEGEERWLYGPEKRNCGQEMET